MSTPRLQIKQIMVSFAIRIILVIILCGPLAFNNVFGQSPTKEVTIKYMQTALKGVIGTEITTDYFISEVKFDGSEYEYYSRKQPSYLGFINRTEQIPWHDFKKFDEDHKVDERITSVTMIFNIKVEGDLITIRENGEHWAKVDTYKESIVMLVPNEKVESFKKAVLRMVELAGDADPFK
ncbi:hypothetical protein [Hymenobacter amundsenii]|nr:hypothetical protein [Hymenobacter amundsenii]